MTGKERAKWGINRMSPGGVGIDSNEILAPFPDLILRCRSTCTRNSLVQTMLWRLIQRRPSQLAPEEFGGSHFVITASVGGVGVE